MEVFKFKKKFFEVFLSMKQKLTCKAVVRLTIEEKNDRLVSAGNHSCYHVYTAEHNFRPIDWSQEFNIMYWFRNFYNRY